MSKEQLEKFIEHLNTKVELIEEVKSAPTAAAVADIAKNLGFDVTAGDVLRSQATATTKLSDSELENISGGVIPFGVAIGIYALSFWGTAAVVAYGINEISKD